MSGCLSRTYVPGPGEHCWHGSLVFPDSQQSSRNACGAQNTDEVIQASPGTLTLSIWQTQVTLLPSSVTGDWQWKRGIFFIFAFPVHHTCRTQEKDGEHHLTTSSSQALQQVCPFRMKCAGGGERANTNSGELKMLVAFRTSRGNHVFPT